MKRMALAMAAMVAVVAMAGCEPSMTITAKNNEGRNIDCHQSAHVVGTVTPHNATGAVQLQQTVGGKWKDVSGFGSMSSYLAQYNPGAAPASPRRAAVNQSTGAYTINYFIASPVETPIHLRVRSNAGSAASPGFYVVVEFC